jgi:hypothetical protein
VELINKRFMDKFNLIFDDVKDYDLNEESKLNIIIGCALYAIIIGDSEFTESDKVI